NEQHGLYVGENELGCFSTRKEKQDDEGRSGADPDRRIQPEGATNKKLDRRRLARGIRDDETGNDKEYFDPYPTEPRERRNRRELNIGGDVAVESGRSADRRPGPGPEHQVKNGDAEGSPEAQRIQQWEVVLHGNSNPMKHPVANTESVQQAL